MRGSEKGSEPCLIVSVMGPPGAGKTTLIKRLQEHWKTRLAAFYIEDGSANPYLGSGFDVDEDFDADASQRWFLDQYTAFFEGLDRQSKLFLDQDPSAVGLVYSKTFQACGALTEGAYVSQLETLLDIESMMSKISACRKIVSLEASTEVLFDRISKRESGVPISEDWIADLNSGFESLYEQFDQGDASNLCRLDSSALSSKEVEDVVLRISGYKD